MTAPEPKPLIYEQGQSSNGVAFQLRRDPRGTLEVPGLENAVVAIHVGPPARLKCRRDGKWHTGTAAHGDIDIVPAHTPSRWQMDDENDMALLLSLPQCLLREVAESNGMDPRRMTLLNRYQVRDRDLEMICWTIQREMQNGYPSGRLYLDGLSLALGSRLVSRHSSLTAKDQSDRQSLSGKRLKDLLSFIEESLNRDLSLAELSKSAGMSASHLKQVFKKQMGLPVHQYVIRRRLERARSLLADDALSMAQIAAASGFAHQSHMARHMRRSEGISPSQLRRRTTELAADD
jgi:AraC family transcriptional regulator